MPRVFITGICSFTGRHLSNYLQSVGSHEIIGCDLLLNAPPSQVAVEVCDVRERGEVLRLIGALRPDAVYHLAASTAEADPGELLRTNVEGTWNLLDACRQLAIPPKILIVGSAASFGEMPKDISAWSEDAGTRPSSFYGLSRATQLELGRVAFEKWALPVFLCRPFNLTGPGLSEWFAPAALARRVLELQRTGGRIFSLRNSRTIRDFVDVRDAIGAYHAILEHGRPGVPYNVGSGVGTEMCAVVQTMARLAGVSLSIEEAPCEPGRDRSSINRSITDITRIKRDTAWQPVVTLEQSLRDMLKHLQSASAN